MLELSVKFPWLGGEIMLKKPVTQIQKVLNCFYYNYGAAAPRGKTQSC